jgi:hypothetical protein
MESVPERKHRLRAEQSCCRTIFGADAFIGEK